MLDGWEQVWRDALDHDADETPFTIAASAAYLGMQMTYMAGFEDAPFEDFARDLRRCRAHMESVLHDGEQVDTGAPCMKCEIPLQRVWGKDLTGDGWACPRCKQASSEDQYRFAVKHLHREEAAWLTDRDMEIRTGIKAATVRTWARDGVALVQKRQDSGRTVYSVEDVVRVAIEKGRMTA